MLRLVPFCVLSVVFFWSLSLLLVFAFTFLELRHWSCSLSIIVGGDDVIYLFLISDQLDL